MRKQWFDIGCRRWLWLELLSVLCLMMWLFATTPQMVQAQAQISYDSSTNTISIGDEDASASELATSQDQEPITIPQLAAELLKTRHDNLLVDQGEGVWLLKANILVKGSARLEVTKTPSLPSQNNGISWLRLESTLDNQVNITSKRGGLVLIDRIKVTSWDSTIDQVDEYYQDGRSYLLASEGGRMDILGAEVAYLFQYSLKGT